MLPVNDHIANMALRLPFVLYSAFFGFETKSYSYSILYIQCLNGHYVTL